MYGALTAPVVGITLRDFVRRALGAINSQSRHLEVTPKIGLTGRPDIVTSSDLAARDVYGGCASVFRGWYWWAKKAIQMIYPRT